MWENGSYTVKNKASKQEESEEPFWVLRGTINPNKEPLSCISVLNFHDLLQNICQN